MFHLRNKTIGKWTTILVSLLLLLGSVAPGLRSNPIALANVSDNINRYLPIIWKHYPWASPFGVESEAPMVLGTPLFAKATNIPVKWVRMNTRISWRQLQPNEGDPIQWDLLASFESELRALRAYEITPIVIVNDYPAWATATRSNGDPSYCGPMLPEKFQAYADFVSQLANRYKDNEFNVHIWEMGNEPDIDGNVYNLRLDSVYGCWGDAADPYYGGQRYGEMLKVVAPAIKTADPRAQVWVGGLLLNSPNTVAPGEGHPELFLQGILQAGVGTNYAYFDVIPYHTYMIYTGLDVDYDIAFPDSPWFSASWGGVILGKAKYLRQLMHQYGVNKPLFINEISLTCPEEFFPTLCNTPVDTFLQMQANQLVRSEVRGLSVDVKGIIWYTLNGPGWRNGGLLDSSGDPRPSYIAYQQLALQLFNAAYLAPVDYGSDFEAYGFRRGAYEVDVVWAKLDAPNLTIQVPASSYVEARTRDGALIPPNLVGDHYQIPVGFSPVYVARAP